MQKRTAAGRPDERRRERRRAKRRKARTAMRSSDRLKPLARHAPTQVRPNLRDLLRSPASPGNLIESTLNDSPEGYEEDRPGFPCRRLARGPWEQAATLPPAAR